VLLTASYTLKDQLVKDLIFTFCNTTV